MKTFNCDICGLSVKQYELRLLYEDMQPSGIEDVCNDCYKTITDAKYKIKEALKPLEQSWIKKIIRKLQKTKAAS